MPVISTIGAMSGRGFGEFNQQGSIKYIESYFSPYLYTGNGSVQSISNGLDFGTEGGLVWIKSRSAATDHALYDTLRGATYDIASNSTAAQTTQASGVTSFNSSGFTIGSLAKINTNAATYVSWAWRETPKYFDIVTYTGNGANRTIAHSLDAVPGMIIIKRTDSSGAWAVYHRSLANTQYLTLNSTSGVATGATYWNSTTPTSTVFSLGTASDVNANGGSYVAYIFAHNAGGFGLDGLQNVISCGSFTTVESSATINLGYEPQFIMLKTSSGSENWLVYDNMRGIILGEADSVLYPNLANAEVSSSNNVNLNATGFSVRQLSNNTNYVYLTVRRGPMEIPSDATTVFSPNLVTNDGGTGTIATTNFPVDLFMEMKRTTGTKVFGDRLRGKSSLVPYSTAAETDNAFGTWWTNNNGLSPTAVFGTGSFVIENFRRAPSFMDVVSYTGTGSNQSLNHNLNAVPQLIIVKKTSDTGTWPVYNATLGNTKYLVFSGTAAEATSAQYWNSTTPTSSVFSVGTNANVNQNGSLYIAYLFSSCTYVSSVGTYTGTGSNLTINCGFAGGARYVLIKRTDSTGDWWVWDTARGMIAGTDPRLNYNSESAEANNNWVYTVTGGFQIVTADATVNASGGTYIYLAIA